MFRRFLVLLVLLTLPCMARAEDIETSEDVLKSRSPHRLKMSVAPVPKEKRQKYSLPILKELGERLDLDKKRGLSFNFMDLDRVGSLPPTKLYFIGTYKRGLPAFGIGFRF